MKYWVEHSNIIRHHCQQITLVATEEPPANWCYSRQQSPGGPTQPAPCRSDVLHCQTSQVQFRCPKACLHAGKKLFTWEERRLGFCNGGTGAPAGMIHHPCGGGKLGPGAREGRELLRVGAGPVRARPGSDSPAQPRP